MLRRKPAQKPPVIADEVRRPAGAEQPAALAPLEEIARQLTRIGLALEVANTLAAQAMERSDE